MKTLIIVLMISGLVFAQAANLKSLNGFSVIVLGNDDALSRTRSEIKTEAELLLRSYKIEVESEITVWPALSITVATYRVENNNSNPSYCYSVLVDFYRKVKVEDVDRADFCSVWESPSMVGICPVKDFDKVVIENVKKHIKMFINDYLSVNK